MKKSILIVLLAVGAIFSSCTNNGNKVDANDAQEVKVVQTQETVILTTIDAASHVEWRAAHLGGVEPRFGKISLKHAKVLVNKGEITNASVEMDMASFTVENFDGAPEPTADLTQHLQGADFFEIETYPTSIFELSGIKPAEGEGKFNSVITGNLTIKGVSKSIAFSANVTVTDSMVSIQSEDFAVDRSDWGLVYNAEGTEGVPTNYLIADDIGFTIDVKISK